MRNNNLANKWEVNYMEQVKVQVEEGLSGGTLPPAKTDENNNSRPEGLPDQFKTVEDLVKSYNELRADYTRKSQELSTLKKGDKPEGKGDNPSDEDVQAAADMAGVSQDQLTQWSEQFWQTGEVPEEAYEAFEKVGITREIIDQYAEGQKALYDSSVNTLLNAGGGKEQVDAMFKWASENLPKDQIERYNKAFDSGDMNAAILAMESLKAAYEQVNGAPPQRTITGGNVPAGGGDVYTSAAQVVADMNDPRYRTDPAFRKAVEMKIARSNVL